MDEGKMLLEGIFIHPRLHWLGGELPPMCYRRR
jgi:hypothetical protein